MNDLELHQLVRDSLKEFKPAYDPRNWRLLQSRLILEPTGFPWKFLALLIIPLTLAGTLWWNYQPLSTASEMNTSPEIAKVGLKTAHTAPIFTPYVPRSLKTAPIEDVEDAKEETAHENKHSIPNYTLGMVYPMGPQTLNTPAALNSYKTYFVEQKIRRLLLNKTIDQDSTTYKVLERNKEKWQSAVMVCDWTSSMFPYGTQIFTWLHHNQHNKALQAYVFFNDCDPTGTPLDHSNEGGGMFYTAEKNPQQVLSVMINAVRKGAENTDLQENDLEALLFASQQYPKADELVLIADNISPVRYPQLLKKVNKPVRIIICGTTLTDQAIQPIYLELAKATGGSIHTIEDDLIDLENIPEGRWIRVGDKYFRYKRKKGKFVLTNRHKRPRNGTL